MTDVYIFYSVRTPRGKGKKDGSLHEVKPIDLGVTVLEALRERCPTSAFVRQIGVLD